MLHSYYRDNFKWARAHSALVALLYVFLCTFGALTHTHAGHSDATETAVATQNGASKGAFGRTPRIGQGKHGLSAVTSCAFCDWEANSQGRTVTPFALCPPVYIACLPVSFSTPFIALVPARASSRAPPVHA